MNFTGISEPELAALLQDESTSMQVVSELAKQYFQFPPLKPPRTPVDPLTIRQLANMVGASPEAVLSHARKTMSDGLAPLHNADLSSLCGATLLDDATVEAIRATFDDIPNHSEAQEDVLGLFNGWASRQRQRLFEARRSSAGFAGATLVAEGDSWFQYPLRRDVIDWLNQRTEKYAICCRSAAGDWLAQMHANFDETLSLIESVDAQALLLSGGGNDLVGRPGIGYLIRQYKPGKKASYYLGQFADIRLGQLKRLYQDIILRTTARFPGLPILIHGYAYMYPGTVSISSFRQSWLQESFEEVGFQEYPALQRAIVRLAIDRFNDMLEVLADACPNVHYIDCRPLMKRRSHWVDELHPTNRRWGHVAAAFEAVLDDVLHRD